MEFGRMMAQQATQHYLNVQSFVTSDNTQIDEQIRMQLKMQQKNRNWNENHQLPARLSAKFTIECEKSAKINKWQIAAASGL